MVTRVGTQNDESELLRELYALESDILGAFDAAVERLEEAAARGPMEQFAAEHRRHVAALATRLVDLGAKVPQGGDLKSVITQGKVVLGGLMGDYAIMMAMQDNEADTETAYERALQGQWTVETAKLLQQHAAQEVQHRAFIHDYLKHLDADASETASRRESLADHDAAMRAQGTRADSF